MIYINIFFEYVVAKKKKNYSKSNIFIYEHFILEH
jgi:hypothetical protein